MREFAGAFLAFTFAATCVIDLILWLYVGYDATISWVINQWVHRENTHPSLIASLGFAAGILANHFFFKWAPGPKEQ